jgi:uncharacterized protein YegP (UPF0339 family)
VKYEYWKTSNGAWAWHLISGNRLFGGRQVVAQGGGCVSKSDVLHAIGLAKLSRPAELNIGQSRRYRLSFAALLALSVAIVLVWFAAIDVLPRWDGSFVITDAAVIHTEKYGKGKRQTKMTKVTFSVPDGRVFSPTIHNSNVEVGQTTVRIRYNPHDPNEVLEDSSTTTYHFALAMLIGAAGFLYLAYVSSLHNGEEYFM